MAPRRDPAERSSDGRPRVPRQRLMTPDDRGAGGVPLRAPGPAQGDAKFRLLVESVTDYAIFMLDPEGHVASWNAGAERIKGYSAEEIIGQHFSRFYPPGGDRPRLARARAGGARGGRAASRTRAGGCARTAPASGPTSSSPRCATTGRAESASPRSPATSPSGAARRRPCGRARSGSACSSRASRTTRSSCSTRAATSTSWNPGAERIKGYPRREIIGQHFSRFYPPDALAARLAGARADGGAAGGPLRGRGLARPQGRHALLGQRRDHRAATTPSGTLRGFAKVTRDLTERRRVEALEEEGQPHQRVPRHARPRAAQPAGADPQRGRGSWSRRASDARGRARPGDHRAPGRSISAASWTTCSTSAGITMRQDRARSGSRSTSPRWSRWRAETVRATVRRASHTSSRSRSPPPRCGCSGDPTRLSQVVAEPARQRAPSTRPPAGTSGWSSIATARFARAPGARRRHRHRSRAAAPHVRPVRPGRADASPAPRAGSGSGSRSSAGSWSCTAGR